MTGKERRLNVLEKLYRLPIHAKVEHSNKCAIYSDMKPVVDDIRIRGLIANHFAPDQSKNLLKDVSFAYKSR